MFREEHLPSPSYQSVLTLEETFKQKPTPIPLELPLIPTQTYIVREPPNYVSIVAIVGIISLFGLFAFLAFLKR